jgi:N-methylhydantoinase A
MLRTDTRHDLVQNFFVAVDDLTPAELTEGLSGLYTRARTLLEEDGSLGSAIDYMPAADLRYVGQEYTVTVPWAQGDEPADVIAALSDKFGAAHLDRYGHNNPDEAVECVNLRVTATACIEKIASPPLREHDGTPLSSTVTSTFFGDGWLDTKVIVRADLGAGAEVDGPAVVLEDACTIMVPPGWGGSVSAHGHLILRRVSDGS